MSADVKVMTLRLPRSLADDLATVAQVDGQPMAEAIRTAIGTYLWRRMAEPDWETERDALLDRMNRLTERTTHA